MDDWQNWDPYLGPRVDLPIDIIEEWDRETSYLVAESLRASRYTGPIDPLRIEMRWKVEPGYGTAFWLAKRSGWNWDGFIPVVEIPPQPGPAPSRLGPPRHVLMAPSSYHKHPLDRVCDCGLYTIELLDNDLNRSPYVSDSEKAALPSVATYRQSEAVGVAAGALCLAGLGAAILLWMASKDPVTSVAVALGSILLAAWAGAVVDRRCSRLLASLEDAASVARDRWAADDARHSKEYARYRELVSSREDALHRAQESRDFAPHRAAREWMSETAPSAPTRSEPDPDSECARCSRTLRSPDGVYKNFGRAWDLPQPIGRVTLCFICGGRGFENLFPFTGY